MLNANCSNYCRHCSRQVPCCGGANTEIFCAGFAGLSSYCPTKYAVRGLADTLRNEVQYVCKQISGLTWHVLPTHSALHALPGNQAS